MNICRKNIYKSFSLFTFALFFIVFGQPSAQSNEKINKLFSTNFMESCMNSYYRDPSKIAISESDFRWFCQCTLDYFLDNFSSQQLVDMDKNKDLAEAANNKAINSCINKL